MDRRRAKRVASGLAATLLREHGEHLARTFGTPDDRDRVRASFAELVAELQTRSGRVPDGAPDPNQVPLFEAPTVTIEPDAPMES